MSGKAFLLLQLFFSLTVVAQSPGEQELMIDAGNSTIQTFVRGAGPVIVMLPSFGRGARDFDEVADILVTAGYRVVLPEPRGIGRSTGPMEDTRFNDWADDVAAVIRNIGEPSVVVGHAFGNRIARTLSSDHPELVSKLILLAAGGVVPLQPELRDAVAACFDETLSREEHLAAVKLAFFAAGNDPQVWEDGWYPSVAAAQRAAAAATELDEWWSGGTVQILVVHGQEDALAVRENAEVLEREFPSRVTLVDIPNAGHAMLPEQPDLIATTIVDWLKD